MSLLFFIDEKNLVTLRPDCVRLCPELSVLKDKEIVWIILSYDYHSPLRQFPEHERLRRAMFQVFGDNMPELANKASIKLAIEAYKSLQYDPRLELIKRYQAKIDRWLDIFDADDNISSGEKTTKAVDSLRNTITALEQEFAESTLKKGVIEGEMKLSFLEELMQNQKYFESVIRLK